MSVHSLILVHKPEFERVKQVQRGGRVVQKSFKFSFGGQTWGSSEFIVRYVKFEV